MDRGYQGILRHGTRFNPSSTRPGHPLRRQPEIRTFDSNVGTLGRENKGEEKRGWWRSNDFCISRFGAFAKSSFEGHSFVEGIREVGKDSSGLRAGVSGRDGEEAVEKNRKVGRVFDSLLPTDGYDRADAGFNRLSSRVVPVDNSIKLVFFLSLSLSSSSSSFCEYGYEVWSGIVFSTDVRAF